MGRHTTDKLRRGTVWTSIVTSPSSKHPLPVHTLSGLNRCIGWTWWDICPLSQYTRGPRDNCKIAASRRASGHGTSGKVKMVRYMDGGVTCDRVDTYACHCITIFPVCYPCPYLSHVHPVMVSTEAGHEIDGAWTCCHTPVFPLSHLCLCPSCAHPTRVRTKAGHGLDRPSPPCLLPVLLTSLFVLCLS